MKTSLSPISGQEYQIPKDLNDRAAIDCFRDKHRDNKIIVVQGLGFVGSVMSLVVANALHAEYAVIGVDVPSSSSYWKIASINEGIFPVVSSDQKIATYFSNTQKKANLYATYDEYAYSIADVVIVDINLDVSKVHTADKALLDYSVDLTDFKQGISSIAKNCKEDVLILVESTVPPGMCDKMITPILNEVFDQRGLDRNYRLGHSYERVMPGPNYVDSIQNFYRVYSGIDEKSADAVEEFLMTVISVENFPLTRLTNTTATEMAKVLENSY